MLERRSYLFSDDFLGLMSDAESNIDELSLRAMSRIHDVLALSEAASQLEAICKERHFHPVNEEHRIRELQPAPIEHAHRRRWTVSKIP